VMLRVYLYRSYQRTAWPQWADQFLPYVIMGTSGGVCLAYFLLRLRTKVAESGRTHPILALGRSGLYGMAATVLAVACSVVVASLWLGPRLSPTKSQIPYHVMLVTIESGTYALGAALPMMPFAFGWGLLGGICILLLSGAEIPPQRLPTVQPSDSGRLPLTLGILGIILSPIPFVGLGLGGLAIVCGFRTPRLPGSALPNSAKVAVVLGFLCLLFWILAFGVYIAARHGWLAAT
jgi:energy-coupling factor transporter transmembrane protein EcfT